MMFSVTCGGLAMGGCLVWQTEQHGMNNNKRCPFKKKMPNEFHAVFLTRFIFFEWKIGRRKFVEDAESAGRCPKKIQEMSLHLLTAPAESYFAIIRLNEDVCQATIQHRR
jgi:hypothetical protein